MEEIRLTEDDMVAYTYILWWKDQNKQYYGVRYAKGCRTSDIGDTYFSSSKEVKKYWSDYGRPMIIIDQQFLDVDEALAFETEVLLDNNVRQNPDFLNKIDNMSPFVPSGQKHPNFGKPMSNEQKEKLRLANLGKKHSDETKKKMSESQKGKRHSEASKEKMSEACKGRRPPNCGKSPSEETRTKISEALKGRKHSEASKKKMSEAQMGEKNHRFGVVLSTEIRQKLSVSKIGDKNPSADTTIRVFKHKNGDIYIGSQSGFRLKYNLTQSSISAMVLENRKSHKGWTYHGVYEPEQPES